MAPERYAALQLFQQIIRLLDFYNNNKFFKMIFRFFFFSVTVGQMISIADGKKGVEKKIEILSIPER